MQSICEHWYLALLIDMSVNLPYEMAARFLIYLIIYFLMSPYAVTGCSMDTEVEHGTIMSAPTEITGKVWVQWERVQLISLRSKGGRLSQDDVLNYNRGVMSSFPNASGVSQCGRGFSLSVLAGFPGWKCLASVNSNLIGWFQINTVLGILHDLQPGILWRQ